jgi:predicted component of type VI protein secretion system
MPTLKVISGPAAGQTLAIDQEIVVGREGADVTIDDAELSRRHTALRPVDGGVEVEDLGSLNGTFVDGNRLDAPTTLSSSVVLRMGTSEIALEIEPAAEPEPIAQPDVTRPRAIPQPDVTAPRKIPEPVADPDVTAPRKIPEPVADPDVTAPRKIPQPDVTAPRKVPEPAAAAPPPPAGASAQEGPSKALLAGLAIALVVLLVVLVLLLA